MSMSVCLSVHTRISRTTRPNLTEFYLLVACGSVHFWRRCNTLCISVFIPFISCNAPSIYTRRLHDWWRKWAACTSSNCQDEARLARAATRGRGRVLCCCYCTAGTLYDAVHRLPRSHLLVVSHVSRRKRAKPGEVRHVRRRAVVGRGTSLRTDK